MKMNKKIAVYMDHFAANILEYTDAVKIVKIIKSGFNKDQKEKYLAYAEEMKNPKKSKADKKSKKESKKESEE